ncbi:MAG TPA: hypothetical protein PKI32_10365, partial [Opitutales bacterium]|nr:hypothetical protein [Opitutales bacterium]
AGVDPDTCAAPAAFDDDNVPWALLGSGLSRPFLRKKAEEARHFHEAPSHPIAKAAAVVHGVYVPPHEKAKARIEAWRKSGIEVPVGVRLSPAMKGLPRSVLAALLASAIMTEWSELSSGYAGYAGSIWKDWETPSVTGIDCFRLRFAFGTAAILTAKLADPAARAQLSARLAPRMEVLERALSADDSVRLSFSSPFKFEGAAWCAANHIKFTLRKPEKTLSVYDFAPQSKKKATVADLSCREEGGRFVVNLAARPGFDVKGFLHSAFALPVREDFFRVDVVAS